MAGTADLLSCIEKDTPGDDRLGDPLCMDCYDYTGSLLFNAYVPRTVAPLHHQLRRRMPIADDKSAAARPVLRRRSSSVRRSATPVPVVAAARP
jgi:hypothetical protein